MYLATQCLWLTKPKTMEVNFFGKPKNLLAVSAKDIVLALIRKIGIGGGIGAVIEYRGDIIKKISMEKRMTICNMSIEAGARAGLIAPDEITFEYIRNREYSPEGEKFEKMVTYWKENLKTDNNAIFDKKVDVDISNLSPQVSWGTNPSMVVDVTGVIPYADEYAMGNEDEKKAATRALEYMNLKSGTPITDICIDRVFIGSCTNSRLEDLIEASVIVKGRKVSPKVHAMVVPGSQSVKLEAEKLGLDKIFIESGFEWRESGCSMCLGMNPDILSSGERCASTSNRNFEGRQGVGGRTHLVSPVMAAAVLRRTGRWSLAHKRWSARRAPCRQISRSSRPSNRRPQMEPTRSRPGSPRCCSVPKCRVQSKISGSSSRPKFKRGLFPCCSTAATSSGRRKPAPARRLHSAFR